MDSKELAVFASEMKLPQYDSNAFDQAVERILVHRQSIVKFSSVLSSANGATLCGDYSMSRISHNCFSDCSFQGASLKQAAATGAIFSNVKFLETNLSGAALQSSTLDRCEFDGCRLDGCNMSECYIHDTTWKGCRPEGSGTMAASYLKKCSFLSVKPGNLAEACLDNVYFENVRLTNLNLEFADFKQINASDTVFAFSQMPYVFGGLAYLLHTTDQVRISSHSNDSGSISVAEYRDALRDLEIFFSYREEFFPLANILLALCRYEEALLAVLQGIQHAALQHDFRMCKYYCKLIVRDGKFSNQTLASLYEKLCAIAPVNGLTEAQYYQYRQHMPEIRSMLVENPDALPHGTISLETTLTGSNSAQTAEFIACLDALIHLNGAALTRPSISISHNSPLVFVINLCGTPLGILAVAALILKVVETVCKAYNEIAQAILSTQTIGEKQRQKQQDMLSERKLSLEIERLELENESLREKIEESRTRITASGIIITHASMSGQDFNPAKWLH